MLAFQIFSCYFKIVRKVKPEYDFKSLALNEAENSFRMCGFGVNQQNKSIIFDVFIYSKGKVKLNKVTI